MFDLIWAVRQQQQIGQAQAAAKVGADRAATALNRAHELEHRVDKLMLACSALWSLLKERTKLTEEDLLARAQEIDLAAHISDGAARKHPVTCSSCGRLNSPRHDRCLYCGARRPDATAFDAAL